MDFQCNCKTPVISILDEKMLNTLKEKGFELAVASNKTHEFTENVISYYFGDELFSEVFGKSEGNPVKPSPAIVDNIMDKLNISKENTVMIGDTHSAKSLFPCCLHKLVQRHLTVRRISGFM